MRVNAAPMSRAAITPARRDRARAKDSSLALEKAWIGARWPKSSMVTAKEAEWIRASRVAVR
jgi:hypothetical protein